MGFIAKRRYEYVLAYLLPLLVLLIAFAAKGIFPFGDTSVLLWDMKIQYVGYFGWLSEVLSGQSSLLYSSAKGMGGGMIALFAYYLSSPFNLFAGFFDASHIIEFLSWLELFKIPAASVTCYIFLRRRIGLGSVNVVLASSYALCGYVLFNASNIMWIDGVIMLPLIALGVFYAVDKRAYTLLFVSVACAIVFNWYTAYIDCLAAALFFVFEVLRVRNFSLRGKIRSALSSLAGFITTMFFAFLASMILFLPTIFGLQQGKGNNLSFTDLSVFKITLNPCDFFSFFCITTGPVGSESVVPAVYISTFALLLAIIFLLSKHINVRIRVGIFILLAMVGAAFFFQPFEIIWSALKKSTSYYYRFSYVFVFILIVCAAYGYRGLFALNRRDQRNLIIKTACLVGVVLLLSLANISLYAKDVAPTKFAVGLEMALIVVFSVLIYLLVRHRDSQKSSRSAIVRRCALIMLVVIFIFEQSYNAASAFSGYRWSVSQFESYMSQMQGVYDGLSTDDGFVRVGQAKFTYLSSNIQSTTAESLTYGVSGLNHYSSTMEDNTESFVSALGYAKRSIFGIYYNSPNTVGDALLGVNYIIDDVAPFGSEVVESSTLPYTGYRVYENEYALPLGYGITDTSGRVKWTKDPFTNQKALLAAMTATDASGLYVTPSIVADDSSSNNAQRSWNLTVQTTGPLYIFTSYFNDNWVGTDVSVNGTFVQTIGGRFNNNLVYLGTYAQGDTLTLTLTVRDPNMLLSSGQTTSGYLQQSTASDIFTAASLDTAYFEQKLSLIDGDKFDISSFSDGHLTATFAASRAETLLLTIPYDKGWTAWVDGVPVSIKQFYDGCMGIPVTAGTHTIELRFTPPGLYAGIALTAAGIGLFIVWRLFVRLRVTRKFARAENEETKLSGEGGEA
jgi:uncharacterized membrane protein YfhO